MEPQIPTSFIPKRPVSSEPVGPEQRSRAVGILSFIATIFVVATALAYGGVYLYGRQLAARQATAVTAIDEARKGIGTDFLNDMKRLDARIEGVKLLVKNHIVVSPIFAALEKTTLRSVQYKSFDYELMFDPVTKADVVQVTLTGNAKNYSTIALQSDAFAENDLIKNPVFSSLTVDDKTSVVNFKLVFTVDPRALSYESFIAASAPATQL